MKFEVINDKNKTVMHTFDASCIPDKETLNLMLSGGYKFKLDGKVLSKKAINELIKGESHDSKSKKTNQHSKNARKG